MAGSGTYKIIVNGILNDTAIRSQLAALESQINSSGLAGMVGLGGKSGKGGKTKSGSTAFGVAGSDAKKAQKNIAGFTGATKKASLGLLDVGKKVLAFGAVTSAIQLATSGIGSMVTNVVDLDASLREYKKVSDLSGKSLEEFTDKAYKAGEATAKTGVEMIDAATEFKKMGYSDSMSLELANSATMFQNIADAEISAGDAATFINSQLKAFKGELSAFGDEAEQAQIAIDRINEV